MYEIIKNVITSGRYELSDMLKRSIPYGCKGILQTNKKQS